MVTGVLSLMFSINLKVFISLRLLAYLLYVLGKPVCLMALKALVELTSRFQCKIIFDVFIMDLLLHGSYTRLSYNNKVKLVAG